jgi:hypothetical protein
VRRMSRTRRRSSVRLTRELVGILLRASEQQSIRRATLDFNRGVRLTAQRTGPGRSRVQVPPALRTICRSGDCCAIPRVCRRAAEHGEPTDTSGLSDQLWQESSTTHSALSGSSQHPRAGRDQSRRGVTEARSTTPAPSIRQASPQTSTAKTTRARLRMVVTTVEMMIME